MINGVNKCLISLEWFLFNTNKLLPFTQKSISQSFAPLNKDAFGIGNVGKDRSNISGKTAFIAKHIFFYVSQ